MNATTNRLFLLTTTTAIGLFVACDAWEYPSPELESIVQSSIPAYTNSSVALASGGGAYVGKVVEITGKIQHIANKGGQPGLVLCGGVICGFGKAQRAMVGTLRVGDQITLRGIYSSAPVGSMGPYLTPCIRVR